MDLYFLILRNRVLRLLNVHIWAASPYYVVDNDVSQESCFQASKRSNMGSAVLESGRCANIHELCFQAANRSDKVCV